MRKLIVLSFITVDGVMQAPGGPEEDTSGGFTYGGWQAPYLDEFLGKVLDEQWREPFDLLLGRKTFEIFASYWPYHEEQGPGPGIGSQEAQTTGWSRHPGLWQRQPYPDAAQARFDR